MLRYKADRRTLSFLGAYWVLVIAQWVTSPRGVLGVALVILTCVLSWIAAVIAHNSLHSPLFKKRTYNRIYQTLLSSAYGFPVSEYVPGHNLSHHRYLQEPRDVMRTSKVRFRWNLLNAIFFVPVVAVDVTKANFAYMSMMKKKNPAYYRQFLTEVFVVWGEKLVLLALDWRKALLYIIAPHLFALWGITFVNYLQHDGCDENHPYNHSRNFVGRIFNWFTFNNGFHGMHHIEPGLHWSLLRAAHEEKVHQHIARELEQPSLAIYVFRAFIWPGERRTFDGREVTLPPQVPDADWMAGVTPDVFEA